MKKIVLCVFLSLLGLQLCFSQQKITSFDCAHLKRSYDIKATEPDENGKYRLCIEMQTVDVLSDEIYLRINSRHIEKCIAILNEAKNTYNQWRDIALQNDTQKLSKKMDIKIPELMFSVMFKYGSWHDKSAVRPMFSFHIKDDNIQLFISVSNIRASDNQYINTDGGVIVMSSNQEIEDFINCFNPELVTNYFQQKQDVDNLFN